MAVRYLRLLIMACGVMLVSYSLATESALSNEMWDEPSHQLVLHENNARVLDIRIVPGVVSEYHRHRFATIYVVIQDAKLWNQLVDGDWAEMGAGRPYRDAGSVIDRSSYVGEPQTHRVKNIDERTFHLVAIVNESSGTVSADRIDDLDASKNSDSRWFKRHHIRLPNNTQSDILTFSNNTVLVQPGHGASHVVEDGIYHSFKSAPGAFSWHPAGASIRVTNTSDKQLEIVAIELK